MAMIPCKSRKSRTLIALKRLAAVGALVLIVFQIAACGSDEPPKQAAKPADSAATSPGAGTAEPVQPESRPAPPPAPPQMDKLPAPITQGSDKASGADISAVVFSPENPVAGNPISVQVEFNREFTNRPVLRYQWKINGQIVQESLDATLSKPTRRGDIVDVTVFTEEIVDVNRSVTGRVTVGGSPPIINKTQESMDAEGNYVARFAASHPDGDPVTVTLQKGPAGMSIDSAKGELRWAVPQGTQGSFPVELLAADPQGGKAICSFSITIRQEQPKASESNAPSKSQ
jgi:hypothetical protein